LKGIQELQENHTRVRPSDVAVDKIEKQLRVSWEDGFKGVYPFEQLRAACPCAECRAYKSDDNPLRQALLVSVDLESAQLVGNYAVQLTWEDGHRFGIYTWEYLRSVE
jgi:DUF971 family protein